MVVGAAILIAVTGVTLLAYGVWRAVKPTKTSEPPKNYEPMRCGTPILQMGGSVVAVAGNKVHIFSRDRVETMTLQEYSLRPDRIDLSQ